MKITLISFANFIIFSIKYPPNYKKFIFIYVKYMYVYINIIIHFFSKKINHPFRQKINIWIYIRNCFNSYFLPKYNKSISK